MRNVILILVLFQFMTSKAQHGEFTIHDNGLMYSEETMIQLKEIVDSLNLKFKTCDPHKKYYSKSQAIATYFHLNQSEANKASDDIKAGMSPIDLKLKYKDALVTEEVLVIRFSYENYSGDDMVEFSVISLSGGTVAEISFKDRNDLYENDLKGQWVSDYSSSTSYSEERVSGFYFENGFSSVELPATYASMVQYGECMVDTNHVIFKEKQGSHGAEMPKNLSKLSLEEKRELLDNLRSMRVVGMCSMDDSPRVHARNIAILAAESVCWEIFLRAHLDIMNDNFDRRSDGSYAWAQRKTYIKELEVLDIDILNLIFGISIRVENPGENHYYGNISRLGRAIAESEYRNDFETTALVMIQDNSLDLYNRIIAFYLFENYNYYLTDDTEKTVNKTHLNEAIKAFPDFLQKTRKSDE